VRNYTSVYPGTDILDNLQGFRKDSFDFVPQHRCRLDLKHGPAESTVPRLITKGGIMFNSELAAVWERLLRIATRAGMDAVIGEYLSQQFLNVAVGSASDDGSNEFDFDADLAV